MSICAAPITALLDTATVSGAPATAPSMPPPPPASQPYSVGREGTAAEGVSGTAQSNANSTLAALDREKARYNESLAYSKNELISVIDARLNGAANAGDLKAVISLRAAEATAKKDGSLPDGTRDSFVLEANARYDHIIQNDWQELAAAYDEAIRALTKARQFDLAANVQAEFDVARELHQANTRPEDTATAAREVELLGRMRGSTGDVANGAIVMHGHDRIDTVDAFAVPVTFKITAMTHSDNLRIAYAADAIIFNWNFNEDQLRVDGGPAAGRHLAGAGRIPKNQWVEIVLRVQPDSMAISVDGEQRYLTKADFSHVNQCLSIFPWDGSVVAVKSVKVIEGGGAGE
jgi:hypothetical protein